MLYRVTKSFYLYDEDEMKAIIGDIWTADLILLFKVDTADVVRYHVLTSNGKIGHIRSFFTLEALVKHQMFVHVD